MGGGGRVGGGGGGLEKKTKIFNFGTYNFTFLTSEFYFPLLLNIPTKNPSSMSEEMRPKVAYMQALNLVYNIPLLPHSKLIT